MLSSGMPEASPAAGLRCAQVSSHERSVAPVQGHAEPAIVRGGHVGLSVLVEVADRHAAAPAGATVGELHGGAEDAVSFVGEHDDGVAAEPHDVRLAIEIEV